MSYFPVVVENLSKEFFPSPASDWRTFFTLRNQSSVVAIRNLNLTLQQGTLTVVVGPNGSGKTTLIRILAGIILPDRGKVFIDGYDIVRKSIQAKRSLSVIFADHKNFYPRLTGRQNLEVFAAFQNVSGRLLRQKIETLALLFRITEYLDKPFQEYSSGIKQRFVLIRGLLSDASVLLMDEPTKNLDPAMAQDFKRFIKDELIKKRGKTILYTTHVLSEVSQLADTLAILVRGEVKATGSLKQLSAHAPEKEFDAEALYAHYVR